MNASLYVSPSLFLSIFLFLCATLHVHQRHGHFYSGSLKRSRQIYVRNPVGCLIQESRGDQGRNQRLTWANTHTHTHRSCVYVEETQHAYSHVQETLNRKYLHKDRYIFTQTHKHVEESLGHKTAIHAHRKR